MAGQNEEELLQKAKEEILSKIPGLLVGPPNVAVVLGLANAYAVLAGSSAGAATAAAATAPMAARR